MRSVARATGMRYGIGWCAGVGSRRDVPASGAHARGLRLTTDAAWRRPGVHRLTRRGRRMQRCESSRVGRYTRPWRLYTQAMTCRRHRSVAIRRKDAQRWAESERCLWRTWTNVQTWKHSKHGATYSWSTCRRYGAATEANGSCEKSSRWSCSRRCFARCPNGKAWAVAAGPWSCYWLRTPTSGECSMKP